MAQPTALIYDYVEDILERRQPHREELVAGHRIAPWTLVSRRPLSNPIG